MVVLQNEAPKVHPYGAQDVVPVPVLAQSLGRGSKRG